MHVSGSSSLAGPRRKAVPSVSASPKRTEISITKPPSGCPWRGGGGKGGGGDISGAMFLGLGDHA